LPPGYSFIPGPVSILRTRDLVALDFTFKNQIYHHGSFDEPGTLVRAANGLPAFIIVRFPQQSIREQAFFENDPNIPVDTDSIKPGSQDPVHQAFLSPVVMTDFTQLVSTWTLQVAWKPGQRAIGLSLKGYVPLHYIKPKLAPYPLPVEKYTNRVQVTIE
jgi:hypothetical protein